MKYRFLILTALLVGGFVYMTSLAHWPRHFWKSGDDGKPWSEPVARSAGLMA